MRRFVTGSLALLLLAIAATPVLAQDDEQARLAKQRDEKLQKAFLKNGEWLTDYDAAMKKASESGRLMFGYFTRSYAP